MNDLSPVAALMLATALLAGCTSKVTSIRDESGAVLREAEGFLLVEVNTSHSLHSILIDGPKDIRLTSADLRAGSNYILVNLPAGEYEIREVRPHEDYYFRLDEDDMWDFSVHPGVISYVGNLRFKGSTFGLTGFFTLVNRSSFALEYLEDSFPGLLASHRVEYGGPGKDDFFEIASAAGPEGQD